MKHPQPYFKSVGSSSLSRTAGLNQGNPGAKDSFKKGVQSPENECLRLGIDTRAVHTAE